MNLVYIHIGSLNIENYNPINTAYTYNTTPDYLWNSIKQSRKYYDGKIYIVIPEKDIISNKIRAELYNCEVISFESFLIGENTTELNSGHAAGASYIKDFLRVCLKIGHSNDHFLCVTFLRLFVLCELIRNFQLNKVWHIENDNLIFANFPELTGNVYCANVSDEEASAGILYISNAYYAQLLANDLLKYYKLNPRRSEMNILKLLPANTDYVQYFPWETSDESGFIYDGASFGQYAAGSNQGHGPGHTSPHHYFTKLLQNNYKLLVLNEKPLLIKGNGDEHLRNASKIFNLHIHNKSQIKYITDKWVKNIAVGLMTAPTLRERHLTCWYTWLQDFQDKFVYTGKTGSLEIQHIQIDCNDDYNSAVEKQFLGLKHMYENTQAEWFVFAGCDTYIFANKLQELLATFDSKMPLYIGSKLHCGDFSSLYSKDTPCKYFVSGGPGLILSRVLVEKLYPILSKCHIIWKNALAEFNTNTHSAASDVALAYILWKELNTFVTFIPEAVEYGLYHCAPKDYKQTVKHPVSFHCLTPNLMLKIHQNKV